MSAVAKVINPAGQVSKAFNLLLTILEKISDENIWKNLLGERLVKLGQKYFGNDFVTLSVAFYLAPILKTHWSDLMEKIFKKSQPPGTVSIRIFATDSLYDTISRYAYEHGSAKDKLNTGVAKYNSGSSQNYTCVDDYDYDYYSDEDECDDDSSEAIRVQLAPPESFDEEIMYKGHLVRVLFKNAVLTKHDQIGEHIEMSMDGDDIKLLHFIIQEWSDEYNKTQTIRYIYRSNGHGWRNDRALTERSLDSVHLRNGQKERLLKDMEVFKSRGIWYKKRGIPYRRGYLLYGPPGTGKTSIIQAIAAKLEMNIAIIGFGGVTDNLMLSNLITNIPLNSIVVMEDIDHVFKTVGESKATNTLNMSGLLNVLDGMQGQEGSMIFMTCNNLKKIEPALLRPGRIDLKLKLDYAASEQIRDTFWRFMNLDDETSMPLSEQERKSIEKYAEKFVQSIPAGKVTTAEVQSYFIDLLLEYNNEQWTKEEFFQKLFEKIPDFLERVEFDRKQSEEHEKKKEQEDEEKRKEAEEEKKKKADEEKKKADEEKKKKADEEKKREADEKIIEKADDKDNDSGIDEGESDNKSESATSGWDC